MMSPRKRYLLTRIAPAVALVAFLVFHFRWGWSLYRETFHHVTTAALLIAVVASASLLYVSLRAELRNQTPLHALFSLSFGAVVVGHVLFGRKYYPGFHDAITWMGVLALVELIAVVVVRARHNRR